MRRFCFQAEPTSKEKEAAAAAKLRLKCVKEGGKKGVEIEGAADMVCRERERNGRKTSEREAAP